MNKVSLAAAIALVTSTTAVSSQAATETTETTTSLKQGAVFTASALAGAAAGGPLGLVLGAIGGAYLGDQVKIADGAKQTKLELAEKHMQIAELQQRLAQADTQVGELAQIALDKLEFQVLFHTGADQLTERGTARVSALANFLKQHPGLSVRLTGHADPRGTDEYNNVLSEHRALSVQQTLEAAGIDSYRIERRALGADLSTALRGDYEAYAMDRRVDIEIFNPMVADTVVQAH